MDNDEPPAEVRPPSFDDALADTLEWLDGIHWRADGPPDGMIFDVDIACLEDDAAAIDQVWRARMSSDQQTRLMLALADHLEMQLPIPSAARRWLIRFLRGELVGPPPKRGRPENWRTPQVIHQAVERLVARGMTATRNDASVELDASGAERGASACDVVAAAFKRRGLSPASYKQIKKKLLEERARLKESA